MVMKKVALALAVLLFAGISCCCVAAQENSAATGQVSERATAPEGNAKKSPTNSSVQPAVNANTLEGSLVADGPTPLPDPPPDECVCSCYSVFNLAYWQCLVKAAPCCLNDAPRPRTIPALWHLERPSNTKRVMASNSRSEIASCGKADSGALQLDTSTIVLTADQTAKLWTRISKEVRPE